MDKDKNEFQKLNLFEKIEDIINNYCESSETPENNGCEDPKDNNGNNPQPTNCDKENNFNEYEELQKLKKYNIYETDWTINWPFDVLKNYILMRTELLCYRLRFISFYKKNDEKDKYVDATKKIYQTRYEEEPKETAEIALLNLNIIDVSNNGIIFCVFEKQDDKKFHFKEFKSSCDNGDLFKKMRDEKNRNPKLEEIIGKDEDELLNSANFTDIQHNIDHITKDKEHLKRLPKAINTLYNQFKHKGIVKELINSIIGFNVRLTDKKDAVLSWSIKDVKNDKGAYYPVNILFPLYYPHYEVCAAMVIRLTYGKKPNASLATIFDLKQAFMGAKLYDPNFESKWLTIENVKRAMKKGCVQEK